MAELISELGILTATARWLASQGWTIASLSIPGGKGLPPVGTQQQQIQVELSDLVVHWPTIFKSSGPDIIARLGDDMWFIECKGIGDVRVQTAKNNFDRAVASVVSYLENPNSR